MGKVESAEHKSLLRGDMTTGPIFRKLILFMLPILLGNVITQMYNVVNSIVVGQFIGKDALAAVGVSFSIIMAFSALYTGVGVGTGVVISQYYGAKNYGRLTSAANTAYMLAIGLAVVVSLTGFFLAKPILLLQNTPANILDDSVAYLQINMLGSGTQILYFMTAGMLRGLGDSKWPLFFLIIAAVMNVGLNLLFVVVFRLGVPGVAISTIIAQLFSAVMVIIRLFVGGYGIKFGLKYIRFDKMAAVAIAKIGLPTGLQGFVSSLGMMVIQAFTNGFGSDVVAANTVMMKVDGFILMPMMAISNAMTVFVGQNVGAEEHDRLVKGVRQSMTLVMVLSISLGALLFLFAPTFIRAFTSDESVIKYGAEGLRILAFFYWFMGINQNMTGIMRGVGAAVVTMIIAMVGIFIRIPLAYWLAIINNNWKGIFISMVIANGIMAALVMVYYFFGNWKTRKSIVKES